MEVLPTAMSTSTPRSRTEVQARLVSLDIAHSALTARSPGLAELAAVWELEELIVAVSHRLTSLHL